MVKFTGAPYNMKQKEQHFDNDLDMLINAKIRTFIDKMDI